MNEVKNIGLVICILMVLMAYLKQAIPKGKMLPLMNVIISVFILLSVINGVRQFDLDAIKGFLDSGYTQNTELWKQSEGLVAKGLKDEFNDFLKIEKIDAEVMNVEVTAEGERFRINRVVVVGAEAERAKNIISGRYQIGLAYVEVINE